VSHVSDETKGRPTIDARSIFENFTRALHVAHAQLVKLKLELP
jgi:hypothetical protein